MPRRRGRSELLVSSERGRSGSHRSRSSLQATISAASSAGAQLIADVTAATSVQALTAARVSFVQALGGGTSNTGGDGLLGGLLTATGNVQAVLDGVVDGVVNLAGNLDGDLSAQLSALADVNVCLNVQASIGPQGLDVSVGAAAQVIAQFVANASASGQGVDAGGAQLGVNAAASAMALAELALRVAP